MRRYWASYFLFTSFRAARKPVDLCLEYMDILLDHVHFAEAALADLFQNLEVVDAGRRRRDIQIHGEVGGRPRVIFLAVINRHC